jgi:hypothetical protein
MRGNPSRHPKRSGEAQPLHWVVECLVHSGSISH